MKENSNRRRFIGNSLGITAGLAVAGSRLELSCLDS
jgi:hypothetical protein